MTRAKRLAIRLPAAAAPATEAPRAASQRYPITVNAHVTAQIAASVFPSAGFGAVVDGRSEPRKNRPSPTAIAAICAMSRRVACSPKSSGASSRMKSGLVDCKKIALAAVQVFGVRKSADTRAALRFFAERRIKVHFVDLNKRAAAVGELRRFAQKFGVAALIDRDSRRFGELGLRSATLSEERWLEKLSLEPLLLRMPLVRNQNQLTIGAAQETWNAWYASTKS